MSLNRLFITIGLGVMMMIFFQNCQKAKMQTTGANLGSLQAVNEIDFQPPPPGPDPGPTPTPNPNPNPNPNPDPEDPKCPTDNGDHRSDDSSSHDHSKHAHYKGSHGHDMCDDDSSDDNSADDCKDHTGKEHGNREYICGISGPGKSDRIGITDNERLDAQHDSQKDKKLVCMSEYACETIARKAFSKSHTIRYGWCKDSSNKKVKHISDENMKLLVDKFILENPGQVN